MGYQALLFCPDEKLARVVSQVFGELDFAVNPAHEPFAAVKQLMAQHYDVIVVDCENEQNASLLFRSARNSNFNQSSLAFALVEGQTGIAKAYRIGANLVLTKPINLEQAKGTLRVARGLLRKNSDATGGNAAATPPSAAKTTREFPGGALQTSAQGATEIHAGPIAKEFFESAPATPELPTATMPEQLDDRASVVPWPAAQNRITLASEPAVHSPQAVAQPPAPAFQSEAPRNDNITHEPAETHVAPGAEQNAPPTQSSAAASAAAAPAPAKESAAPPLSESKPARTVASPAAAAQRPLAAFPMTLARAADTRPFGALNEDAAESGRKRKLLIAAVVVLALAALGYLTNWKFGNPISPQAPAPVTKPQDSAKPSPVYTPTSAPADSPSTSSSSASTLTQTSESDEETPATTHSKPSAGLGDSMSRTSRAEKRDSAPIVVTAQQPADDSAAAPAPSAIVTTSPNPAKLSGLISSASYSVPSPSFGTMKVSQGVSQGLLIKRVQPIYPPNALAAHTEGSVEIEATVNKEGIVVHPKVLKGNPLLARAALDAVRQWRYKPYYLNGQPVEIQTQITVKFKAN